MNDSTPAAGSLPDTGPVGQDAPQGACDRSARGPLDLARRTVDSPLGPLLLAATETGLVRVAFRAEGFDEVLEALGRSLGPRSTGPARWLDPAARQLEEYFDGTRRDFGLPLDRTLSAGFRREVQQYLPRIGYGTTNTYKTVAAALGSPRAVRAVGTACATNPLPIVVPCHRVLRSDGGLGGYLGGLEAKRALLDLESPAPDGRAASGRG